MKSQLARQRISRHIFLMHLHPDRIHAQILTGILQRHAAHLIPNAAMPVRAAQHILQLQLQAMAGFVLRSLRKPTAADQALLPVRFPGTGSFL